MARLAGVDLPRNKRMVIALTYIYGIGPTRSAKILEACGISQEVVVLLKDPEVYKNRVDQSVRCEQGLEDQRIGYKGCRTGQEHACAEESLKFQVLVIQELSKKDRKDQHDRHLNDQVQECISDRGHEHLVGKHSRVVVENRIIPLHVGTGSGLQ